MRTDLSDLSAIVIVMERRDRLAKNAGKDAAAGGMLRAYRLALDPTPGQARALASHCGAARKAFNEGLAHVRRRLDQRAAERSYGVPEPMLTEVPWSLPALRRWWNASKDELAPWWRENSKEAYSSGLDALARGLRQFSASRSGKRRGPKTGFPRFKSRRRRVSCRFTTGAIRVDGGQQAAGQTGIAAPQGAAA